MNDVVERVARAIDPFAFENGFKGHQEKARVAARAAIEAMREPMMRQLNAAVDATGAGAGMSWVNRSPQKLFAEAWKAMLSAALADASPDIGKEG